MWQLAHQLQLAGQVLEDVVIGDPKRLEGSTSCARYPFCNLLVVFLVGCDSATSGGQGGAGWGGDATPTSKALR